MPISGETRAALDLLKDVQAKVRSTPDGSNLRANSQVNADLNTLISVLESPVFQSILNIQDSLRELKRQASDNLLMFQILKAPACCRRILKKKQWFEFLLI